MTEQEVDELEKQIKAEYEANLFALRQVRKWLREGRFVGRATIHPISNGAIANGRVGTPNPVHHPELNIEPKAGTIEAKVLDVINKTDREFTLADVHTSLRQAHPSETFKEDTVAAVVYRNKGKLIKVVRPGRRGQAAQYMKI